MPPVTGLPMDTTDVDVPVTEIVPALTVKPVPTARPDTALVLVA